MRPSKKDKFLEEVLRHIKFHLDRSDIKSELECHILDKTDYYIKQGYDRKAAEHMAVNDMGDAKVIGAELNRQHNPFLGWFLNITNAIVILLVIPIMWGTATTIIGDLLGNNWIHKIPKSDIAYSLDIDERAKLDDTNIRFTKIVYERNKDMNIFYEYYDTKLLGTGWSLVTIGNITDNLGNEYLFGGGGEAGGIKSKGVWTVENFSEQADTLIISYNKYNRKYRVSIPLKEGVNNE